MSPTALCDAVIRARDQRRNWLGHILRMEGHRITQQVLLKYVKPTPESILGDVLGLDIQAAISLAKERAECKENIPSRCY